MTTTIPRQTITPATVGGCGCPGEHSTVRSLQVLRNNDTPVAKDWTGILDATVSTMPATCHDPSCPPYTSNIKFSSMAQLFQTGSEWAGPRYYLSSDVSAYFDIKPQTITRASVQELLRTWPPKIAELKSCARSRYNEAEITSGDLNNQINTLDGLASLLPEFQKIVAMFDKYDGKAHPKITEITL